MPPASPERPARRSPAPAAQAASRPLLAATATGNGPRLVLVHGFTQSAGSWRRVLPYLPEDHQLMTVDLPGHGGSGQVEVSTLGEAADLLGEVGGPATYLGYSLGGRTCLELALRRPELVQALVLVGATAGIEDPAGRAERRAADEALAGSLEEGGDVALTAFFERWLAGPLFSHLTQEQADMDSRLVNTAAGLAASLRTCGTGTQRPSWDRLGQLAMPVLAVAGEHDERFVRLATRLAAAIGQNASRELVPGAGHAACFERPDAFGALVTSFLTRVGGPA